MCEASAEQESDKVEGKQDGHFLFSNIILLEKSLVVLLSILLEGDNNFLKFML